MIPSEAVGIMRKGLLVEIKSPGVYRTVSMNQYSPLDMGGSRERIRASV